MVTNDSGLPVPLQFTHASNEVAAKQLQTFQSHNGFEQPPMQFMSQQQASVAMQARTGNNFGQGHVQSSYFGVPPGAGVQPQYAAD